MRATWSSGVYIKHREKHRAEWNTIKLIRHYRPRSLFLILFRTVFPSLLAFRNEDKWSAGAISTWNQTGTAEEPQQSPIVNGPDVGTFIVNERGLCTPYWNVHRAWSTNVSKKRVGIIANRLNNFQYVIRIFFEGNVNILSSKWFMLIYPILRSKLKWFGIISD